MIVTATKKEPVEQKVTMVDAKEIVEFKATSPNELIGHHTVYRDYGTFVFDQGKLEVTAVNAKKLRKDGLVK